MTSTTLRQQQLHYQPQIWKVEMSNPRVSPHAEARWSETAVFDDSHRHVQHRRVMATFLFCSRDAALIFCPCRCGDLSACGRGQSPAEHRRHVPRAVAADVSRLSLHVGHTDSELEGCLRRPEDPRVPSVLCPGVSKKFANFLRPTSRRFSRTSCGSLFSYTAMLAGRFRSSLGISHFFPPRRWRVDPPRWRVVHSTGRSLAGWSWSDRGHHVPALTATSGGRGVGFDMACCNVLQQSGSFSGHERGWHGRRSVGQSVGPLARSRSFVEMRQHAGQVVTA